MARRSLFRLAAAALAGLAISGAPAARQPAAPPPWQMLITPADRIRLHLWRDAWMEGVAAARAAGRGDALAAAAPLFDPDAGIAALQLPDGEYRCHAYRLGGAAAGQPGFLDVPVQACRIGDGHLTVTDGMQRPAGRLWRLDDARLIFLGSQAIGDERRALDYGRDAQRDMVGMIERIGDRRWRLVLPRPRWQSRIDIVDIVPA